ncbi:helix-turn-helix transcriptional regulator [Intestinibacillus massiliensis]|nr:helix-turn-helix transcriptional regulator [Intestinibacillus massiliensis]
MFTLRDRITYEEFVQHIHEGIVTEAGDCPVTPVLTLFQGKWKNQIIYTLCRCGTMRFGALKRALDGITNTMLSSSLRELEADGLVTRMQFNEIPPRVEYALTEKGGDLMPIFYAMMNWGLKYGNK